jgi:signal transduction histidine kinase
VGEPGAWLGYRGRVSDGSLATPLARWVRPAVVAITLLVLVLGAASGPLPSGPARTVLFIAMAGVVITSAGVLAAGARVLPVQFAILVASSAALAWVDPTGAGFVGGFATVSAAARLPKRAGLVVTGLTMIALGVAAVAGAHRPLVQVIVVEFGVAAFYRVGDYANRLRERTDEAERLLAELRENRAAQVLAATLAERQRLAREMHDVLAHSLSGLAMHLEGARLLAVRDAVSPSLLDTIERAHHLAETGLGEARQAIGMLREDALPGPELLPTLAEAFHRDTGTPCRVEVSGTAVELSAQARLTLYRVAQEALTNVRKHATPDEVKLSLVYQPAGTTLSVVDSGRPVCPPAWNDHGYGVTGMRERAELLGGALDAGPTETGFRVRLWLPA